MFSVVSSARLGIGALSLTAVLLLATDALGANPRGGAVDRVVYPTGSYPADVENVQAAADLGGTVLLRATNADGEPEAFDFGTPELAPNRGVFLDRDVIILGESVDGARTTIRGGLIPFRGLFEKVYRRIEGIVFDGPMTSAIIITRSSGADIVGNHIRSVVGRPSSFLPTEGRGIKFLGNSDPDGAVTGQVRVVDNVVEDMHADLSDAIVFDAVAADVEIAGNEIRTVQSSGIFLIDAGGLVTVEDNLVVPGPGDPPPEFSFGNGITIVWSRGGTYRVRGNEVVCDNPLADGIAVVASAGPIEGAVFEQNHITMNGSVFGALTFVGEVIDAYVGQNLIAGTATLGLNAFGFGESIRVRRVTYQGNNVSGLDASAADVFFNPYVRDVVFLGDPGTVIDLGMDNQITGEGPMNGAEINEQLMEAQREKREVLMRALPRLTGG